MTRDYQLYWGDLHSHCAISYGHGTVEQALLRAQQQLDFCSITGHAFWPDMPTDRETYGEIIDYHREGFARLALNWPTLLTLQDEATQAGRFIVFPSYEWHSLQYGDHNVYAMGPDLPLTDAPDLPSLRQAVQAFNGIAIPHHIGYRAGYRGINWNEHRPDCSPFVEIFSLHGCSLSDDAPYPMLHDMGPRDFGSTAEAGWQMGHHFGIAGGTDHHGAYPGSHGDGRMGVFATELTRESLWEAFLQRRVYAATGDRIDASLFLDGAWIGETVRSQKRRHLKVVVRGSDAIDRAEVIKNGRVLARLFPSELSESASSSYRLRITWGWGRKAIPIQWHATLSLSEGAIHDVETCFSGQAIVAPQDKTTAADEEDLPHEVVDRTPRTLAWRSVTQGNLTMRHETTQALSLEIQAPLCAQLRVEANGVKITHQLGELLHKARSHYLRGWLSEAIRIGPLVPLEECCLDAELFDDQEQEVDAYRLQVAQRNGHWAWLTPIWTE